MRSSTAIGSNKVSEALGYERNGVDWDIRRGEPGRIQRWRLTRSAWETRRRNDIELTGVEDFLALLNNH
jgi:hypothetical protein